MGSKDLAEASSTGREVPRSERALRSRPGGSVAGACEGRRLLLPLTCRAEAEPRPLRGAARGFPDGTSWRAGPGRALHGGWDAPFAPLPG